MSIISCSECGKKISSLAPVCSHCGFRREEVSDEQLAIFRQRMVRERIYRLNMISYAVITVFVAAFGWYWWSTSGFQQRSAAGPFYLMGASAFAYLVVRGFLFRARKRQKELKRLVR